MVILEALAKAWRRATEPYQRVHVTPYIYENPRQFRLLSVTAETDYSNYRWTVDTREDLELVRVIYDRLGNDDTFTWRDVLTLLAQESDLAEVNRRIPQKSLYEG